MNILNSRWVGFAICEMQNRTPKSMRGMHAFFRFSFFLVFLDWLSNSFQWVFCESAGFHKFERNETMKKINPPKTQRKTTKIGNPQRNMDYLKGWNSITQQKTKIKWNLFLTCHSKMCLLFLFLFSMSFDALLFKSFQQTLF